MASKVDICNLALIESGNGETISSLDERTVAAERCKRLYDVCRKEVLSQYPWSFATKLENLARVNDNVEGGKFAYVYPSDCLRILNTYKSAGDYKSKNFRTPESNNNRVSILDGQKVLLLDSDTPFAKYIYDEQVEENFPPLFVKLLYLNIALRLLKLSGAEIEDIKVILAEIQSADEQAKSASISEDDNHINIEDDYYINARG